MRQPDIEIYLRDAELPAIDAWLKQALGPCSPWQPRGQTFKSRAGSIVITWLPRAVGKWHCLLLEGPDIPWDDDLACARTACSALGVEVRCAPGGWSEAESLEQANRWMRITSDGEEEINWHTS